MTYADARAFAQAGSASPFRSHDDATRLVAAMAMATQRAREIASIEAALVGAKGRARTALRLRLAASRASATSWAAYENEGAVREREAVITPAVAPNPLVVV